MGAQRGRGARGDPRRCRAVRAVRGAEVALTSRRAIAGFEGVSSPIRGGRCRASGRLPRWRIGAVGTPWAREAAAALRRSPRPTAEGERWGAFFEGAIGGARGEAPTP